MITCVSSFVCLLCMALVNAKSNRIVGGQDAQPGQFKYQISLQHKNRNVCGAAIIGDQHVLTAAHCVIDHDGRFRSNDFQVVAGSTNLLTNEGVRIKLAKIYVPRAFSRVDLSNDIAVLKLQSGLGLDSNPNLHKISLPSRTDSSHIEHPAVVAGYGFTSIQVRTNPETGRMDEFNGRTDYKLKYCMVEIISNQECRRRNRDMIYENQICGLAEQRGPQGSGICRGDSGGPLVQGNTIIGVASTCPVGCREHERAAVYTRVSSFIDFIGFAMEDVESDMLVHEINCRKWPWPFNR